MMLLEEECMKKFKYVLIAFMLLLLSILPTYGASAADAGSLNECEIEKLFRQSVKHYFDV